LSAQDTSCKSFDTTIENITEVPLRKRNVSAGKEVEIVYDGEPSSRENAEVLFEEPYKLSARGDVQILDNNKHLETPGEEEVETSDSDDDEALKAMGMTLVDDMWLNEDQLPSEMRTTSDHNTEFAQSMNRAARTWKGSVDRYLWPENTLKYRFVRNSFSRREKNDIIDKLRSLEKKLDNCIKFRWSRSSKDTVNVGRERSRNVQLQEKLKYKCSASIGYNGGQSKTNYMNLGEKCMSTRTIEHEFLHTLGLYHTHTRPDRDNFVTILKDNIKDWDKRKHNFDKQYTAKTFGLPYDFGSVMHYWDTAFSKNRNRFKTIVAKERFQHFQSSIKKGVSKGVSKWDIRLIKKMYNCD